MMIKYEIEALEYISKLCDGGMRDAITLLDKCLAYSTDLTLENVVKAIGTVDFSTFFELTEYLVDKMPKGMIELIERLHSQGKDLKLFVRTYTDFILDICKFDVMGTLEYTQIPNYYEENLAKMDTHYFEVCNRALKMLISLNSTIKWDTNPKAMIEANLYQICMEND